MQSILWRAQIDRIDGNRIFYAIPQRAYGEIMEGLEHPEAIDPANLKRLFLEVMRSTYVGSKRRLTPKILTVIPEEVRSAFDPMCGFSAILIGLAARGVKVRGNDLNPTAYIFSKAIFLSKKPTEEECKEFINSVSFHPGYFSGSKIWPSKKIPGSFKRYIDGFVKDAQNSDHPSFYMGVMANFLSSLVGSFGGPYHDRLTGNFQIGPMKSRLRQDAKEMLKIEASGKITNQNAFSMEIPNVDLIYFDPPYFEDDPNYFRRYSKLNAILLQEEWTPPPETTQKQVEEFGKKLVGRSSILVISSASNCPISWKKVLGDPRRNVYQKRFVLEGTGLSNAAENLNKRKLSEILWISAKKSLVDVVKAGDPFMVYQPEDQEYKYMMHLHARGRSLHLDLRIDTADKDWLLGWTLMIAQEGKVKKPILTMEDLKKIVRNSKDYLKIDFQTGEWAQRRKVGMKEGRTTRASIVATRKAPEPAQWAEFQGVTKPGAIGATSRYPGVFLIVDRGKAEWGASKPWLHELWLDGKVFKRGRYIFRQLRTWRKTQKDEEAESEVIGGENLWAHISELNREALQIFRDQGMSDKEIEDWLKSQIVETMQELDLSEEDVTNAFVIPPGKEEGLGKGELGWLFINPTDQVPYVISQRAINEEWLPPKDFNALPAHWRKHVQDDEKYWEMDGKKALEARKALRGRWKKEGVLKKATEGAVDPWSTEKVEKNGKALTPSDVDSLIPKAAPKATISMKADFQITYQWWKKVKVIREGPSRARFHIWLKTPKKVLDISVNDSILETRETGGILYTDRTEEDYKTAGYVKSGTKMNPTKATPSFIKVLDHGTATILIDSPDLKKVRFSGSKLKGTFLFNNVESYWSVRRVKESPKEE